MKTITEQSAIIDVEETEIATRDMDVFYNPKMKHNRDVSVALLASLKNPVKTIGLPMCATGVRAIRFAKELSGDLTITANDLSPLAISRAKQFAKKNGVSITWSQGQSDLFFCNSTGLDYIDIDPFGSPNPFLDMAMKRLNRGGILAVSATDTAALCGTSDAACIRKYNGKTSRSELKYEAGVRILIRKVQEVGAQYDKALT
ncbi:MAG: tRNA (guanine26-N2/guanine27-N2)-dimethyltransferase, partial [Candidatus Woesearchaeota archaeon]